MACYSELDKVIQISYKLTRHELLIALVHELVHLVQYEDNEGNFSRHYKLMHNRFGYENNPYEKAAFESEKLYYNELIDNTNFLKSVLELLGEI